MNREHDSAALSASLRSHADALNAQAPTDHAVEAAQLRLDRAVAARNERAPSARAQPLRRRARWLTFAATACAALALILVPLLVSERGALAFAEVQRHFENFRTLSMTVENSGVLGEHMPKISVVLDDIGNVRTDVGEEVSVVVNAAQGQVLMLMHDGRMAMRFPIDAVPMEPAREALDWIDELREFKGLATPLPETRIIDGHTAYGWSLKIASTELQLWAREDGLPLSMSIGEGHVDGGALDLRFRFDFDQPIDPALLSTEIPAGYSNTFGI